MGKPTGFMEITRQTSLELPPEERIRNFNEFHVPLHTDEQQAQGARCMDCGVPFCQSGVQLGGMFSGCPLNNLIPEWNDLVYQGKWELALHRLRATNRFPEFTSRVCPALCEAACTCGDVTGSSVTVRENEHAIVETGYAKGWLHAAPPPARTGKSVAVIGSGPAGYTAAIYASRANLQPILYEGIEPGGQLTTTTEIENFPGFTEGIDGPKLMDNMRRQALRFGADIRPGVITSVDLSSRPFHVIVNGEKEIQAEALIISTGAAAKYLGLPSEEKFKGMGVSACATCDGFFYRKKDVAVVGGGDTACEEATYLASICRQVYLIVRKPYLRASKAMQERVMNTPNIKVLFEHNTAEVLGDETGVTGALLRDNKGTETKIDIAGFFVAIGHHPNTEIFADQLELDAEGYIKTVAGSSRTSVEGVFAAGDVQDPHYRQAITAAGSGCMAALDCERFLLQ